MPVMKEAAGESRNAAASAMSFRVPLRPVPELSIRARMRVPDSPAGSARPIGVETTPGLIVLTRAPRAPRVKESACTRRWSARLANVRAAPGFGRASDSRNGRPSSSPAGVERSAVPTSGGSGASWRRTGQCCPGACGRASIRRRARWRAVDCPVGAPRARTTLRG
ncbi:hypothetical protein GCM10010406_55590 [Streptomyces thermolineatus]|uniref:Uncharacterized protein n=1 Tax=Streptomyces thermolineatus TaxID=44033 RepID=A0ABN3N0Z1_9ACTN